MRHAVDMVLGLVVLVIGIVLVGIGVVESGLGGSFLARRRQGTDAH